MDASSMADASVPSDSSAVSRASQIMSFLDKVESEAENELRSCVSETVKSEHSVFSRVLSPKKLNSSNAKAHLGGFSAIKEKLVSLKVQLEDKTKTCELLQQSMEQLKRSNEKRIKELESEHARVLKTQKKESETTIQRHLEFVDRLLADKQNLSGKCDELAGKIREIDQEYVGRIEKIHNEHRRMLKRAKEAWIAAESVRREQWIQNKTKSIKAMTIKGLEPEIQRLIDQNKRTIDNKDQEISDALREQREELLDEYEQKLADAKARALEEKNEEIAQIREQQATTLKQQHEMLMKEFDQQKCRAETQFSQERHRLLDEHERLKQSHVENASQIEKTHAAEIEKLKSLHRDELENEKRHHQIQVAKVEETCRIEKSEWQEMMTKKLQQDFIKKEGGMRQRLQEQQREELDVVIERLTKDFEAKTTALTKRHEDEITNLRGATDALRDELQQQIDKWMQRCASKEKEIASIESESQQHAARTLECQQALAEKEKGFAELNGRITDLESQAKETTQEHLSALKKQKMLYQEQLRVLEDKCDSQHEEIELMNANQAEELRQIIENHSTDMDGIEARVRQMVCKKDDVIQELRDQLASKDSRISQIEELLEQQRAELFAQV